MRPFTAPISDRSRELFGTYQRRYETPPSMSAFDAPISDRRRELYGEYRSRWSKKKVGLGLMTWDDADGINWVDCSLALPYMGPTIFDTSVYQIRLTMLGGWAGTGYYRILIDDEKVYPFSSYDTISSGTLVSLGTLSNSIRTGETCLVQFKSGNAGDTGPAQSMKTELMLALFK